MVPYPTKLEEDKSSGQMIWTNFVRLEGFCAGMHRNQTREEIDEKLKAAGWAVPLYATNLQESNFGQSKVARRVKV